MSTKKIISLDFDGVLHSYKSGWSKASEVLDPPVTSPDDENYTSINWLIELIDDGRFDIQIFSARNAQEGGIDGMKQWLTKWGLPDRYLEKISFPIHKPPAHVTIDDRAINFDRRDGFVLGEELDALHDYQPWMKRGRF